MRTLFALVGWLIVAAGLLAGCAVRIGQSTYSLSPLGEVSWRFPASLRAVGGATNGSPATAAQRRPENGN
jgi:hypothetical protein